VFESEDSYLAYAENVEIKNSEGMSDVRNSDRSECFDNGYRIPSDDEEESDKKGGNSASGDNFDDNEGSSVSTMLSPTETDKSEFGSHFSAHESVEGCDDDRASDLEEHYEGLSDNDVYENPSSQDEADENDDGTETAGDEETEEDETEDEEVGSEEDFGFDTLLALFPGAGVATRPLVLAVAPSSVLEAATGGVLVSGVAIVTIQKGHPAERFALDDSGLLSPVSYL
jgi:hypothetical protein